MADLTGLGATLTALSPQSPAANRAARRKMGLDFPVLSDAGLKVSEGLGLVFELPAALQAVYRSFGIDLSQANADGRWRLPMPSRLIVGPDLRVRHADVQADYTVRPEPSETLARVRALVGR